MKTASFAALITLPLVFTVVVASGATAEPTMQTCDAASVVQLRTDMRALWEQHVMFTRNYVISSIAGLGDTAEVGKRLNKNQDAIGDAITPYCGADAGKKLSSLLRTHIAIAGDVVVAAKAADKKQLDVQQKKWTANGKDIAVFLAAANPNLKQKDLESMMQKHLDLTTAEVVARLKKDWAGDIKAYDEGDAHMMMFSDALAMGIAKQFPKKFEPAFSQR